MWVLDKTEADLADVSWVKRLHSREFKINFDSRIPLRNINSCSMNALTDVLL